MAFDRLGISCFVNILKAVVLSSSRGVFSCIWPISINMIHSSTAFLAFTYVPAISASEAAPIILRRILDSTWIEALINIRWEAKGLVKSGLFLRKWYPLTLLLPPDTDRYDESKDT